MQRPQDVPLVGVEPDPLDDVIAALRGLTWHRQAACIGADPRLFFPRRGSRAREAKAICRSCPVRGECLAFALTVPGSADHGVWGGLTKRERDRLRHERGAA